MKELRDTLVALVFASIIVGCSGCGGRNTTTSKAPDTRSAVQYFKEQQASTETPHGKIVGDTVEEKDGKIQYKTADGKSWKVGYSKRTDGTYQYGTPEERK